MNRFILVSICILYLVVPVFSQFDEKVVNQELFNYRLDRKSEALAYLNELIGSNPNPAFLYMTRAEVFASMKQFESVIEDAAKAIQIAPTKADYRGATYI